MFQNYLIKFNIICINYLLIQAVLQPTLYNAFTQQKEGTTRDLLMFPYRETTMARYPRRLLPLTIKTKVQQPTNYDLCSCSVRFDTARCSIWPRVITTRCCRLPIHKFEPPDANWVVILQHDVVNMTVERSFKLYVFYRYRSVISLIYEMH